MRATLLLVLATSISASYLFPEDAADGVYTLSLNAAGEQETTLISTTLPRTNSAKFRPRSDLDSQSIAAPPQFYQTVCVGTPLNMFDTDTANAGLDNFCGSGHQLAAGSAVIASYGGTISFFCNYLGTTNDCYASERQQFIAPAINGQCGYLKSGWVHDQALKGNYGWLAAGSAIPCNSP